MSAYKRKFTKKENPGDIDLSRKTGDPAHTYQSLSINLQRLLPESMPEYILMSEKVRENIKRKITSNWLKNKQLMENEKIYISEMGLTRTYFDILKTCKSAKIKKPVQKPDLDIIEKIDKIDDDALQDVAEEEENQKEEDSDKTPSIKSDAESDDDYGKDYYADDDDKVSEGEY